MKESKLLQLNRANQEKSRMGSDSLVDALANLYHKGKSQLFWDKLEELKKGPLGQIKQFEVGIQLIEKRLEYGGGRNHHPAFYGNSR